MVSFRTNKSVVATAAAVTQTLLLVATTAPPAITLAAASSSTIRINEVSDKGTSDGTCDGNDWIELYLPPAASATAAEDDGSNNSTSSAVVVTTNLDGFILHDDNGPTDIDAFRFAAPASMTGGEYLLLCCGSADGASGPKFKIGGDDAITLVNAEGVVVSTTGILPDAGDVDVTYAFFDDDDDEDDGGYSYTTTPTPMTENVLTTTTTPGGGGGTTTVETTAAADDDVNVNSVRINEVSDKGTSSDVCDGNDWIELYLPMTGIETDLAGGGYILHDDNGPQDADAFNFTSSSLPATVMTPGDFLLLCCGTPDGLSGPSFKIGGEDTITFRNRENQIVSTTGKMTDGGSNSITYIYDDTSSSYMYTGTPTPGTANILLEPLEAYYTKLDEQNQRGMAFFDMDSNGHPLEGGGGFAPVVDVRMEMDPEILTQMNDEQTYEMYVPFVSATVTSKNNPNDVLLELPYPGRIRPRGQSTLAFGTCLNMSIPYGIDWDYVNETQTLFGAERTYLRNHLGDGSYVREWTSHRMLARFGLPHLRTRTVRFFLNGGYVGLYSLMEAPDQDYVFRRSFGNFNPKDYAIYKVKTMASAVAACGSYDEDVLSRAQARIDEVATPPYAFERGSHRDKMPVLGRQEAGSNWFLNQCAMEFFGPIMAEMEDTALAYLRTDKDCGKMLVEQELVDRDLGVKSMDDVMMGFINRNLADNKCLDPQCSNSNLISEVDVDNWLRNFAVYAVTINQDSPMGNGNNYLLAESGDGKGWKIVQYDHNNVMSDLGAVICDMSCLPSTISWSIERPTCRALDQNPLVGPLLTDPTLRRRYMEYVREFVANVAGNTTFLEQIRNHLVAIEEDVMEDPWIQENGTYYQYELSMEEGDPWLHQDGANNYVPLLPALRARTDDILDQLDAHDMGDFPPRPIEDIHPGEPCVDWKSKKVGGDSPCHDGCYYDGCYNPKLLFSSVCDAATGACFQGTMDPMCTNVTDFTGYDGITNFEGNDETPFCMTNPFFGPAKTASCPPPPDQPDAEAKSDNSSSSAADGVGYQGSSYTLAVFASTMVCALVSLLAL